MKLFPIMTAAISVIVFSALLSSCSEKAAADSAGPSGGDVVAIQNGGSVKAEVVTNPDTGEVMVHTWDSALESAQPIEAQSMTLGSGEQMVELEPHPLSSDPAGQCSRFYGQAEWMRGGSIKRGWLRCCGGQGQRQDFAMIHGWAGGQMHGGMWSDMGGHRRGMGGLNPGMGGHR